MAKIHHNNYLDTINELITDAKNMGIIHLAQEGDGINGRELVVKGKNMLNFGTCGYLGLELDERLKSLAIEFIEKYGTQFSVSRAYISLGVNNELEDLISKMYRNYPVIVYSSTSAAHISLIPSLVSSEDGVILDQQVHMSVQTGVQLLRQKGITVEMIRHSNMQMLERKILELGDKYKKIWYFIDGVYSMYGDVAPVDELKRLMDKYPQLHIYSDDAHGMGWYGTNGTGYMFEKAGMNDRMILVTTLAKGFGVTGGIAVLPNKETYTRIRNFGGPLTYSHPLAPPLLGAAIAAARIMLSDEIKTYQAELAERIAYCNKLLENSGLPVISDPLTPIYFIGMGQPRVGYNMVKRLLNDGFYLNISLFPAVPVKNTGLRFTLTRHLKLEDIAKLIEAIKYHFPRVLAEENTNENEVRKLFKLPPKLVIEKPAEKLVAAGFTIQHETTAKALDEQEWDNLLGDNGSFDKKGLLFLEDVFSGNKLEEENWKFHYYIIRDKASNKPVLATFFTVCLYKDDMLAHESISKQIEEKRKELPYYATSVTVAMGCVLTEGNHLYLDRSHPGCFDALKLLLNESAKLQESVNANVTLFRDFDADDVVIKDYFFKEGFVKIDMPLSNVLESRKWETPAEFLPGVSARNRRHLREDVFRFEHYFDVEIRKAVSDEEAKYFYSLYKNVENRNLAVNLFDYPKDILNKMSLAPNWEFIILYLKPEFDPRKERKAVAAVWCYKSRLAYSPMIVGMDYDYVFKFNVYRQALYQVTKRAKDLGKERVYFGYSADIEKRKFGSKQFSKVAYVQAKDNFNFEVIESMAVVTEISSSPPASSTAA